MDTRLKFIVPAIFIVALAAAVFFVSSRGGESRPLVQAPVPEETLDLLAEPMAPEPPDSVSVPILVYHNVRDVTPSGLSEYDRQYEVKTAEFERQMKYLADEGFKPVSFSELHRYLTTGQGDWPEKPVIITLDDGRRSQIDNAWPILKRLGLTATFFVFTNAPDRNDNYLTWKEISELKEAGNEIGSHTVLHPYLTKSDDEELNRELTGSRGDIEKGVGEASLAIAYPFGLSDERVWQATSSAGYGAARGLGQFKEITVEHLMNLPGYIVTGNFERFKDIVGL